MAVAAYHAGPTRASLRRGPLRHSSHVLFQGVADGGERDGADARLGVCKGGLGELRETLGLGEGDIQERLGAGNAIEEAGVDRRVRSMPMALMLSVKAEN